MREHLPMQSDVQAKQGNLAIHGRRHRAEITGELRQELSRGALETVVRAVRELVDRPILDLVNMHEHFPQICAFGEKVITIRRVRLWICRRKDGVLDIMHAVVDATDPDDDGSGGGGGRGMSLLGDDVPSLEDAGIAARERASTWRQIIEATAAQWAALFTNLLFSRSNTADALAHLAAECRRLSGEKIRRDDVWNVYVLQRELMADDFARFRSAREPTAVEPPLIWYDRDLECRADFARYEWSTLAELSRSKLRSVSKVQRCQYGRFLFADLALTQLPTGVWFYTLELGADAADGEGDLMAYIRFAGGAPTCSLNRDVGLGARIAPAARLRAVLLPADVRQKRCNSE